MPDAAQSWPALPTETEIYILPNGEIVVADLPAELAAQLRQLKQPHEEHLTTDEITLSSDGTEEWTPPAHE